MSETETQTQPQPETNTAAPMRLRAEPPRVTRLSRKMLAGVAAVALVGIGGSLIYALQTRVSGKSDEELYSTTNRQPADGLAGLPRDYRGPILGPALPGDLGGPIRWRQPHPRSMRPRSAAGPKKKLRALAPSSSRRGRDRRQQARCLVLPDSMPAARPANRRRRTSSLPSSTPRPIGALSLPTA
jgi:type IV secretory pathway VirB10-like protein